MLNPWATVVSQWTLGGLYQAIDPDAVTNLVAAKSDADRDAKCLQRLQRMQRFYRQKLIQKFRADYPDDLATMQTFMQGRIQRLHEFNNYRNTVSGALEVQQPSGMTAYPTDSALNQSNDGVFGVTVENFPRLFLVQAPVTNTLLAGEASRGEFIGVAGPAADGSDMPSQLVYINQGTKAAPIWVAFDDDSIIDFLINPSELLDCGYVRTVFYLQGYGTMMDNGDWADRMKNMPTAAGITMKEALEAESLAFGLLRPSLDGSGIVTDFVRQTGKRRKAFF